MQSPFEDDWSTGDEANTQGSEKPIPEEELVQLFAVSDDDGFSISEVPQQFSDSEFEEEEEDKPKRKKAAPKRKTSAAGSVKTKKAKTSAAPKATTAKPKDAAKPRAKAAAKPRAKAVPKLGDAQAKQAVLDFVVDHNRPYNHTILFDNLHGTVAKSKLPIILDNLYAEGKIACKEFGKSKIYFPDQSKFAPCSSSQLNDLEGEIKEFQAELQSLQAEEKTLKSQVKSQEGRLTDEQLDKALIDADNDIEKKSAALEVALKSLEAGETVETKDVEAKQAALATSYKQWKKLYKIFKTMIDDALGESEQTPADFLDKAGIEDNFKPIELKL